MEGTGWMMGGMALFWVLVLVLIILAIVALAKYISCPHGANRSWHRTG
jgi:hypothetical protein